MGNTILQTNINLVGAEGKETVYRGTKNLELNRQNILICRPISDFKARLAGIP